MSKKIIDRILLLALSITILIIGFEVYLWESPDIHRVIKIPGIGIKLSYEDNVLIVITFLSIVFTFIVQYINKNESLLKYLLFCIPLSFFIMSIYDSIFYVVAWITISLIFMSGINFYFNNKIQLLWYHLGLMFIISTILLAISSGWYFGIVVYMVFYYFFVVYTYSAFYKELNSVFTKFFAYLGKLLP